MRILSLFALVPNQIFIMSANIKFQKGLSAQIVIDFHLISVHSFQNEIQDTKVPSNSNHDASKLKVFVLSGKKQHEIRTRLAKFSNKKSSLHFLRFVWMHRKTAWRVKKIVIKYTSNNEKLVNALILMFQLNSFMKLFWRKLINIVNKFKFLKFLNVFNAGLHDLKNTKFNLNLMTINWTLWILLKKFGLNCGKNIILVKI